MQTILNSPMTANDFGQHLRLWGQAADEIPRLRFLLTLFRVDPRHPTDALDVSPFFLVPQGRRYGQRFAPTMLCPTMRAVGAFENLGLLRMLTALPFLIPGRK